MPKDASEAAADMFAAAYADALSAGVDLTTEDLVALARQRAGEAAAPAALAEAARVAATINQAATALASDERTAAAEEAVSALDEWADIEHTTEVLAASIAAAMSTPGLTFGDKRAIDARAYDIAATMSRPASAAAAQTALERAIVARAVAEANAAVVAGAAADARDVVREIAATAARIRDMAAVAADALRVTSAHGHRPTGDGLEPPFSG